MKKRILTSLLGLALAITAVTGYTGVTAYASESGYNGYEGTSLSSLAHVVPVQVNKQHEFANVVIPENLNVTMNFIVGGKNWMGVMLGEAPDGKSLGMTASVDETASMSVVIYETAYGDFAKLSATSNGSVDSEVCKIVGDKPVDFLGESTEITNDMDTYIDVIESDQYSDVPMFLVETTPQHNVYSMQLSNTEVITTAKSNITNELFAVNYTDGADAVQLNITPIQSVIDFDITSATTTITYDEVETYLGLVGIAAFASAAQ